MKTLELPIQGMTCQNCVRHVTAALRSVPGVEAAEVSLERRRAKVEFAEQSADRQALVAAIEHAGYTVSADVFLPLQTTHHAPLTTHSPVRISLAIEGMHCASCV